MPGDPGERETSSPRDTFYVIPNIGLCGNMWVGSVVCPEREAMSCVCVECRSPAVPLRKDVETCVVVSVDHLPTCLTLLLHPPLPLSHLLETLNEGVRERGEITLWCILEVRYSSTTSVSTPIRSICLSLRLCTP